MLDRLMGGEGDPDPALSSEYNLTDLELNMCQTISDRRYSETPENPLTA